jgi:hypothetical protein
MLMPKNLLTRVGKCTPVFFAILASLTGLDVQFLYP